MIFSVLCQIFHPRWGLITTTIHDLQIPYLETWHSEEGNFEMNINGLFFIQVSLRRFNSRQLEVSTQDIFSKSINRILVTCELFDGPFQSIMLWNIACSSCRSVKLRTFNIFRNGDKDIYIVCNTSLFVVTFHFNYKSDSSVWRVLHNNVNWKKGFHSDV